MTDQISSPWASAVRQAANIERSIFNADEVLDLFRIGADGGMERFDTLFEDWEKIERKLEDGTDAPPEVVVYTTDYLSDSYINQVAAFSIRLDTDVAATMHSAQPRGTRQYGDEIGWRFVSKGQVGTWHAGFPLTLPLTLVGA